MTSSLEKGKGTIDDSKEKVPLWFSKRWILAYIGFFGFFFLYSLRVNMSVAIVCMVKDSNETDSSTGNVTVNVTDTSGACKGSESAASEDLGEFDWDKSTQSMILSSFFYGYLVLQIPGGWVAGRFGGRRVLGTSLLVAGVATLLVPLSARWDVRSLYSLRVITGIAEGVAFPAMHTMMGRWAPPMERTRLASLTYAGLNLGNILTFILSGILCSNGFDNGWGSIFYLSGGATLVWVAAWFYLVADSPDVHPTISDSERNYIMSSISGRNTVEHKKFRVPWLSILKSQANYAALGAHLANNWMFYTLLTGLPTFMKEVLHFNIEENGVLSSVPYMVMMCTQISCGHLADYLRRRWLTTTQTRKLMQSISLLASGACIVSVGFIDCEHRIAAVVMLAVAVGFGGLCYAGYMVNHVDFAPRYAGVMFGINNLLATVPGIVAPIVTAALTPNKTQEEWRNVFYVCGAFTVAGTIVFAGFAKGELEPWAKEEGDDLDKEITVEKDESYQNGTDVISSKGIELTEKTDKMKNGHDNLGFNSKL